MTPEQALACIEQERLDVMAEGMTAAECENMAAYVLASAYRKLVAQSETAPLNGQIHAQAKQPITPPQGGQHSTSGPDTQHGDSAAGVIPEEFKQLAHFYDAKDMPAIIRAQEDRIEHMRRQMPQLRGPDSDPQNYRRG